MQAQEVNPNKPCDDLSPNSLSTTLKRSMKSLGVHEQVRLQPPKDSRPVSSMSFTGSATSRDSGCSFGEQVSPVNFTCGETNTNPESPPLAEQCNIVDFLPLSHPQFKVFSPLMALYLMSLKVSTTLVRIFGPTTTSNE
uniref:Uncharacterized protein n=1 Tax=Ditylenchus dipsaci TaxID=166011 RepID=A0A915ED03_9BILA